VADEPTWAARLREESGMNEREVSK
jgi:hypothetical protein